MSRSKAVTSRRKRRKEEETDLETGVKAEASQPILTTEGLFRQGEVLTRVEIESRIEQSKLVRRSDDEFFRLFKARFFKQKGGSYIVR